MSCVTLDIKGGIEGEEGVFLRAGSMSNIHRQLGTGRVVRPWAGPGREFWRPIAMGSHWGSPAGSTSLQHTE